MTNIYLVSRDEPIGYDTYDSFVCYAPTEYAARHTSPCAYYTWVVDEGWHFVYGDGKTKKDKCDVWTDGIDFLKVQKLGVANDNTVDGLILASFNAG